MQVEKVEISKLKPWDRNPRKHAAELALVVKSIEHYGWTNPILVQRGTDRVIAGHGRIEAAKALGMAEVPVIYLDLNDQDADAYTIADNQLALLSEWDRVVLKDLLEELDTGDFDMDLTGFDEAALEELMTACVPEVIDPQGDPDEVCEPPAEPITRPGDLVILGRHRLLCGDSTSITDVERLMAGAKVDMVYTDPPYGIKVAISDGKQHGSAMAKRNTFDPIIGDDSTQTAIDAVKLTLALKIPAQVYWGANHYAEALPPSSCWLIWDKQTDGNNFADAELAWTNQPGTVRLFRHLWNGMMKASEKGEKRVHPTQKPVALAEWCFEQYGGEAKVVMDLFGGSGSTLIACEKTNRDCLMVEMSPAYCDTIVNRWEKFTGQKAQRPE